MASIVALDIPECQHPLLTISVVNVIVAQHFFRQLRKEMGAMETRYSGSADIRDVIADGIASGEVVLPTELGEIRFRVIGTDANTVSGRTEDRKLVTVNLSPPYRVRIS